MLQRLCWKADKEKPLTSVILGNEGKFIILPVRERSRQRSTVFTDAFGGINRRHCEIKQSIQVQPAVVSVSRVKVAIGEARSLEWSNLESWLCPTNSKASGAHLFSKLDYSQQHLEHG